MHTLSIISTVDHNDYSDQVSEVFSSPYYSEILLSILLFFWEAAINSVASSDEIIDGSRTRLSMEYGKTEALQLYRGSVDMGYVHELEGFQQWIEFGKLMI